MSALAPLDLLTDVGSSIWNFTASGADSGPNGTAMSLTNASYGAHLQQQLP